MRKINIMFNNKKIAIVHDHLGFQGGGERTALILALGLGADFVTAYKDEATFTNYQKKLGSRLKTLSTKKIYIRIIRFFWLRYLFRKNRKIFQKYDVLIASGQTATEAVAQYAKKTALKIVYTHSTPRRVFDLYEFSKKMYPFYLQPLYTLFVFYWKHRYLKLIKRFNINIANSKTVEERIKNHTLTEAHSIVYPPIESIFQWIEDGDYFFSWGRIDEAKRIDLIVKAFKKIPDKKIIIASGGPKEKEIRKLAEGADNIKIIGWVSDFELKKLLGSCLAVIYIPINEDSGMTHLEANMAGKVVIGVNEGGFRETIIDGKTGVLLRANPCVQDLINAVKNLNIEWCQSCKQFCEDHAKKFSKENFVGKIKNIIVENDLDKKILGIDASRWENPKFLGQKIRTGVENYSYYLIKNIIKTQENKKLNIRLRIYTPRLIKEIPRKFQKVIKAKKRWTQKHLNQELKYSLCDYFFTPAYYLPKNAPDNSVATIHDVIFKSHPQKYSFLERIKLNYATKNNFKRAKKIITISQYSKKQIQKYYSYPGQIKVIPLAYDFQDREFNSFANKKNQIIYLGRIEKKKNIDILINAFAMFNNKDWKLFLIGADSYGADDLKNMVREKFPKVNIEFTGYLEKKKKNNLLENSKILIHPNHLEGSCFPLFEAWQFGLMSIVPDTELFREIADQKSFFFKKNSPDALKKQIEFLVNLKEEEIIKKQKILQEYFSKTSWEKAAQEILDIFV